MFKLLLGFLLVSEVVFAASINDSLLLGGTGPADSKSQLDVRSTTKGVLLPRMTTTQQNAISSPTEGLLIYDNVLHKLSNYNGTAWTSVGGGGGTWGSITGTLSAQTDLNTALGLLAPIASPTFTGSVTASTFVGAVTGNVTGNVSGTSGSTTGNAATVTTNANLTGPITSSGNTTSVASQTGTGSKFVMDTSPTLITPALGTPSALVGTNISGTAAGLTAGTVTTNANLTGNVTSVGNATTIATGVVTNSMLAGSIDLTTKVTGALPIANGGTANTTKTAAFDALSPLTSTGDMLAFISSHNARVATTATTITWPYVSGGGTVPNLFSMLAPSAISGGIAKNYLSTYNGNTGNGNFENSTVNNWSLGLVGTLANGLPTGTPTFGSGTSGNLSLSVISSGPIAGTYSMGYVSAASTTVGNMVASDAFTIDTEDQAKVMTIKFYYNVHTGVNVSNFSGTSSNSFAWALWDATNSVWLSGAGNFCMTQNSGVGYCTGTVQTGATTASARLVLYNANATTGATTLYLDDFYLGPQTAPMGPAMTDSIAYTPTFTGFGTVTAPQVSYRRNGKYLIGEYAFSAGTTVASVASFTIPAGLSIDTSVLSGIVQVGSGGTSATPFSHNVITQTSTSTSILYFSSGIAGYPTPVNGSTWITATAFSGTFQIPIVGWSSNTAMSSDTDTRVVAMQVLQTSPTATVTSSFSLLKFTSGVVTDTHGAFSTSTGQYTVPVTGYYRASASASIAATYAATNASAVGIGRNSTTVSSCSGAQTAGGVQATLSPSVSCTIFCNAGDTLNPIVTSAGTTATISTNASENYFQVERLSGPAVVQATESVNMRYTNAAGTSITNSGTDINVPFATKGLDSHNCWNGTQCVIPVSGKYFINCTASFVTAVYAIGNLVFASIYQNGAAASYGPLASLQTTSTTIAAGTATAVLPANAGDTLECRLNNNRTAGATTLSTTSGANHVEIYRVGN